MYKIILIAVSIMFGSNANAANESSVDDLKSRTKKTGYQEVKDKCPYTYRLLTVPSFHHRNALDITMNRSPIFIGSAIMTNKGLLTSAHNFVVPGFCASIISLFSPERQNMLRLFNRHRCFIPAAISQKCGSEALSSIWMLQDTKNVKVHLCKDYVKRINKSGFVTLFDPSHDLALITSSSFEGLPCLNLPKKVLTGGPYAVECHQYPGGNYRYANGLIDFSKRYKGPPDFHGLVQHDLMASQGSSGSGIVLCEQGLPHDIVAILMGAHDDPNRRQHFAVPVSEEVVDRMTHLWFSHQ